MTEGVDAVDADDGRGGGDDVAARRHHHWSGRAIAGAAELADDAVSSLASIIQVVGEVAPAAASVGRKSNAALFTVLGVVAFLVLGGIAAIVGFGIVATKLVRHARERGGEVPSGAGVAAAGLSVAGVPHCGRFAR